MQPRIATIALLFATTLTVAQAAELRDVRVWEGPDATRVVFDLSENATHKVFTLSNPERVVIDLDGVSPAAVRVASGAESKGMVRKVRAGERAGGVRVVLDVTSAVNPRSFALDPSDEYGFRVVLDLPGKANAAGSRNESPAQIEAALPVTTPAPPQPAPAQPEPRARPVPVAPEFREKPIVVAVDAGHGGEDPGARGRSGLLEKDVTLAIARRLVRLINAEPGMKAVLTREGDYYVGLRDRVVKARGAEADLFVSVHANAYKDRDMHGTAVYTLSNRGATSEQARWLANKENSADLVGGIEIQGKDAELAQVLIDLSQDATMEASFDLGERVLHSMGKVNKLQKRAVQQAGFAVLKAPDIPSVLVETAFITNDREENMLADHGSQETLASAILEGIRGYFSDYRPHAQVAESAGLIKVSEGSASGSQRLGYSRPLSSSEGSRGSSVSQ